MKIRKAVVLAAGFGKRLNPLTLVTPKPLLPVWEEPMLERTLALLEDWGVEEITVNAHHLADRIESYCRARQSRARLRVSVESEILGTGGALNPLRDWLGGDPFWLVSSDVVIESLDPKPLEEAFARSGDFAGCWIVEAGPRTIEVDPEGRVCNWRSDDAGFPGTYTYGGCALLSRDILDYLPPKGFATIIDAYEKAMMQDARFVVGVEVKGSFWWDAGTIESYRQVNDAPQPVSLYGDRRLEALVTALGWRTADAGAEFLDARGSNRAFWRLVNADDGACALGVAYDDAARPENARYAGHTRLLAAAGVPVPRLLADLPAEKMLALEFIGGDSLEKRATAPGVDRVELYKPVVAAIRRLHVEGTAAVLDGDVALEPAFGPELYAWERDLFETHCVKARYAVEAGLPPAVRAELEGVAAELGRFRPALLHRDFQSSNVLYRADGSFAFIDYQGMRLGPAVYDLASLLYDPYVGLDEKTRARLLAVYGGGVTSRELALGAVQRLVQALGAYGRLASVGQPQFQRHVGRALGLLLEAADEADLDALGGFVEDLIAKEEIRLGHFPHSHDHHHHEDEEVEG